MDKLAFSEEETGLLGAESLIIVTGAAGMIGSGVVRMLNDLGHSHLLLVDDLKKSEKWKNLVEKRFVDIISRHHLFDLLPRYADQVEAIVHLGACSDTMESDGDYLLENNYRFSIRLAEWALSRNKRFIYASSAATYGNGAQGFSDDEASLEELKPVNMYGFSKHLVDLWMKRQGVLNKVVGLKYFNVFGPNEYHKERMASMVFKMTHIVQNEGVVYLYQSNDPERFADGDQRRDFIYLKDAVRFTCMFLFPEYAHLSGIYNIGTGQATTWNELALSLFSALRKKPQIIYRKMPEELNRQYQNYTCADVSKLTKILGVLANTVPIPAAVREYVQTYLLKDERW